MSRIQFKWKLETMLKKRKKEKKPIKVKYIYVNHHGQKPPELKENKNLRSEHIPNMISLTTNQRGQH